MIHLENIRKDYVIGGASLEVLKGIDLDVQKGDFLAVMGPSGSGKSTLLNIIGCLDRQTAGTYHFEGIDVSIKTDDELAEIRNTKIGFVFQMFNLLPRFSAFKNIELPLSYSNIPYEERKERVMEVLSRVGISQRASHKPNELSGGEQQRVAIARALLMNPSVILADEPTGNLDSRSGGEIMDIFKGLNNEGVTIILVTHETAIAQTAKKIMFMKDGVFLNESH
ncbi:MAG: ABC transporter ATP-binding protein [Nitrospirae bacterium]|nr:ABC transporter ATP-binding protein [Nitrospirota bacterium]